MAFGAGSAVAHQAIGGLFGHRYGGPMVGGGGGEYGQQPMSQNVPSGEAPSGSRYLTEND